MFRRGSQVASVTRRGMPLVQQRAYTDYHHFNYPCWNAVVYGSLLVYGGGWLLLFRWGSNITKRAHFKEDPLRSWRRKVGTGYKWSDEWGPEVKNIYTNLPSSAV